MTTPIRDIEQELATQGAFVCDSCGDVYAIDCMVVVPAAPGETADHADGWHICRDCACIE